MQKIEIYCDIIKAYNEMSKYIESGWRVHTCTMCCTTGYSPSEKILVVYEK